MPTWTCTCLPNGSIYQPVSALSALVGGPGSRSLRPAQGGVLVVTFARTAAMQNRAFSVAGPMVWNDLPQELHLFPRLWYFMYRYISRSFENLPFCPHWSWERF